MHGGEPGSPSESIAINGAAGVFNVVSQRVSFNFAATPVRQVDEFRQVLHGDALQPLLDDMLQGVLFRQHFAEEDSHGMADAKQEQWQLRRGRKTLTRTFHEPFPQLLTSLRERLADCARAR